MTTDNTHMMNGAHEFLPWLFIADEECSCVVNKDSSLLASWEFSGLDYESGYDGELEKVCNYFDNALRSIADYQPVVWTRLDRRPYNNYNYGEFPDVVSSGIDGIWGNLIKESPMYLNKNYLSIAMPIIGGSFSLGESTRNNIDMGMKPLPAFFRALTEKFAGNSKKIGFSSKEDLDVLLARFNQSIVSPINNGATRLKINQLKGEELLGFLKSTASANDNHPVHVDFNEYLDSYLSDSFIENNAADFLVLSGNKEQYAAVFTLKKAPSNDNQQYLNQLLGLPVSLTIASCWKAVSQDEAEKFLKNTRTFDEMRQMEVKQLLRTAFSQGKAEDDGLPKTEVGVAAMELKKEVKQRRALCGWLTTSIIVFADSPQELKIKTELVTQVLETSGLVFIREREGKFSGFCTGIPGQLTEPVRWHFVEAANLTDVTPLVDLTPGDNYHPFFSEGHSEPLPPAAVFRTRANTPFYFNNHFGQLGHTLLIGPSRNGKTVLQMFLEYQFLKYPNARIFNIDKDYSLKPQTLLMGGEYVDLTPGIGGLRTNPVALASDSLGRTWLVGWLDRLLSYRGNRPTDTEIMEVSQAVDRIASVPGARLSSLLSQLPESLRVRLAPWCEGGAWGQYFDNEEDTFEITRIMSVEVGGLVNAGLTDVVAAFTEYAFYRIERSLMDRKADEIGPTMIYFEEAGFLLDDEIFANKARDYLMTLAKKKAFLVMTSQSPEPFLQYEKLGAAVRDNVATVIFMPNGQATGDLGEKYKKAFNVNDNHNAIIADAVSKSEYCIWQPQKELFRLVQAHFPPSIISALRSDAASQALLNKLYTHGDESWKEKYLEQVQLV